MWKIFSSSSASPSITWIMNRLSNTWFQFYHHFIDYVAQKLHWQNVRDLSLQIGLIIASNNLREWVLMSTLAMQWMTDGFSSSPWLWSYDCFPLLLHHHNLSFSRNDQVGWMRKCLQRCKEWRVAPKNLSEKTADNKCLKFFSHCETNQLLLIK